MVASKVARVAIACGDRSVRRLFVATRPRCGRGTQGGAGVVHIAGASTTSNVLAGKLYGIPVSGTMAHSYVIAFENEISAFRAYARVRRPNHPSHRHVRRGGRGAQHRDCAKETEARSARIKGVRIDSGALASLTPSVRQILDDADLDYVQIVLSGDLDEFHIRRLLDAGVPADASGVGTQLGTSGDAPHWEPPTSSSRTSAAPASSSRPARQRPRGDNRSTASLEGVSLGPDHAGRRGSAGRPTSAR